MWLLLKAEIEYNSILFLTVGMAFVFYSLCAITNTQLLTGPQFEIDYWGGIIGLFLYLYSFAFWAIRVKEKRDRIHVIIPIPIKMISITRLLLVLVPMMSIFVYLVVLHLLIIPTWHQETASLLMQSGLIFIIIITILVVRDVWLTMSERNYLTGIFYSGTIILFVAALLWWIFIQGRLLFYQFVGGDFGRAIFFFIAFIFSPMLIISFVKRKSFLN